MQRSVESPTRRADATGEYPVMHIEGISDAQSPFQFWMHLCTEFTVQSPPSRSAFRQHQIQIVRRVWPKSIGGFEAAEKHITFEGPPPAFVVGRHPPEHRRNMRHGQFCLDARGRIRDELMTRRPIHGSLHIPRRGQFCVNFCSNPADVSMTRIDIRLNPC